MRIINLDLDKTNNVKLPMCACIGYFDGMHKGHRALIKETIELSQKYNCPSALITFDKDPFEIIQGNHDIKHISTFRQKINLAVSYGIQNIIILHFTKEMCELEPHAFINKVLKQVNLKALVCGFDFRYGYKGAGDCYSLRNSVDYEVVIMDAVEDDKGKISSTRIIEAIKEGNLNDASKMLDYYFTIEGMVISGNHEGTKMGFPTANIEISNEYVLPPMGVYAGYAFINGQRYKAMINLGHNPTINYSENVSLEVHILDYKDDLYGKMVSIEFVEFVRDEMKFKNRDNLIMQLEQDAIIVNKILNNHGE